MSGKQKKSQQPKKNGLYNFVAVEKRSKTKQKILCHNSYSKIDSLCHEFFGDLKFEQGKNCTAKKIKETNLREKKRDKFCKRQKIN